MTDTNAGRSVGQALVALLKDHGVDTIFGIPGVHNNELYRGLLNSGQYSVFHKLVILATSFPATSWKSEATIRPISAPRLYSW